MANVREILARLNPQTIRYDLGRGGMAELTNQDIAAALAFVPAGLGREVLEVCWWPDGAARRRSLLRDHVVALVTPELRRQRLMMDEARTDYGLAVACMGWSGGITADQLQARDRAEAKLEQVQALCWPKSALESLPTLTYAVIGEIARRNLCPDCAGRGERLAGELVVRCVTCCGHGVVPISDRRRAAGIGRDEAAYRRNWRGMYEWLLVRLRDAESEAAAQLSMALDRAA